MLTRSIMRDPDQPERFVGTHIGVGKAPKNPVEKKALQALTKQAETLGPKSSWAKVKRFSESFFQLNLWKEPPQTGDPTLEEQLEMLQSHATSKFSFSVNGLLNVLERASIADGATSGDIHEPVGLQAKLYPY